MDITKQLEAISQKQDEVLTNAKQATESAQSAKTSADAAKVKSDELETKFKGIEEEISSIKADAGKILNGQKAKTFKGFNEQVAEQIESQKDAIIAMKDNSSSSVNLTIKAAGTMTISGNYSGGTVGLTDHEAGIEPIARRRSFIRQLISVRPTNKTYVSWAEKANPDGGAGMTAEAAAKTQADFDIVEASKKVEKITSYIKASKESLDDIEGLRAEINAELLELIALKLDEQLLSGNGTTPNLKGLKEYAVSFAVAATALANGIDNANRFDVIRVAAWQVVKENFNPTIAIVNPIDAALMDLVKDANGNYVMPPFSTSNGQRIAGLTIIANNGVAAGEFIVGDFSKSVLRIREEANISIGYENDDFTKNLVTILAEMRVAHYVKANNVKAFVKGTFATAMAALETA